MSPTPAKLDVRRSRWQHPSRTQAHDVDRAKLVTPFRKSARTHRKKRIQEHSSQVASPYENSTDQEHSQEFNSPSPRRQQRRGQEHTPTHYAAAESAVPTPPSSHGRMTPSNYDERELECTNAPSDAVNFGLEPIQRWIEEGVWAGPKCKQTPDMAPSNSKKRTCSSPTKLDTATSASSRESKYTLVKSRRYEQLLRSVGIHMDDLHKVSATKESISLCRSLLEQRQKVPDGTLFDAELFQRVCQRVRNKTESRVIRDLLPLLVPPAEILFYKGASNLEHLTESVNERWVKSIPFVNATRPQPDYAVGLDSSAFSLEQMRKLQPSIGDLQTTSRIAATDEMLFPFLTVEVKCGNAALDAADRQNAHSAAVAVNAVVELYRMVARENELHREVLAFSISHDAESIRLYGHYAVIQRKETLFYRHIVDKFDFTRPNSTDKWIPYTFTKNIYDKFYPIHYERVCSAVNQLPMPDVFVVEPLCEQANPTPSEQGANQPSIDLHQQDDPNLEAPSAIEPLRKKARQEARR